MTTRTAVITGGGRGLGADIARAFHAGGYQVAVLSRSDHGHAAALGQRARYVPCDARRPESLSAAMGTVIDWSGRLDVLVNNAGRSAWRPLDQIDEAFWDDMLAVNVKSVLFASQAAVRVMSPGGCIVNISSL